MFLQVFPSGPLDTNAYVFACSDTKAAAIVDPSPGSHEDIQAYIAQHQLQPKYILLTHSHWDHIGDTSLLKELYSVPVAIHPEDAQNLEKPGSDRLPCWIAIKGVKPDILLKDGDEVAIGNLTLRVMHTPGHSPGSVCYYEPGQAVLLAGDTLFQGSIGNLSLPTSEPPRMWKSLAKLATLPGNTRVYPGHGGNTTIGQERWLPQAEELFGN